MKSEKNDEQNSEDVIESSDYVSAAELYNSVDEIVRNHDNVVFDDGEIYVPRQEVDWNRVDEEFFSMPERKYGTQFLYLKCVSSAVGFAAAATGLRYGEHCLTASGTALGTTSLTSAAKQVLEE